ncbi:MAG TPA: hypothetical protein VK697_02310, partial [Methylomirabilota bacterium]|nr:hypothetical protein [Methylomirabilota bacterium]
AHRMDPPTALKEPPSMKRNTSRALVAVLAATLSLTGAVSVAAKDHTGQGKSATHGAHAGVTKAGVVKAAPADRPATVAAIVHFASGDVPAVLTQSGGGSAYHANVPVPAAETAQTVLIDATAVVAGVTLTAQGSGKIVIEDTTQAPLAPASPASIESPATCTSPGTDESPEASDAPKSPEAGDSDETPEASEAPEASKAPDAAENSDGNSEDCQSSDGAGVPLSADTIAKIVAFLQSLFA